MKKPKYLKCKLCEKEASLGLITAKWFICEECFKYIFSKKFSED